MKINPKSIIERHKQFPESTEQLIESYAFQEYQKAINDLLKFGQFVEVKESDTVLLVISKNNYKNWRDLKDSHWYLNDVIKGK